MKIIIIKTTARPPCSRFFRGKVVRVEQSQYSGDIWNFRLIDPDDKRAADEAGYGWNSNLVFSGWVDNALIVPDNAY